MPTKLLVLVACACLAMPCRASASPTPGCADSTSPGKWSQVRSEYGDQWFELELSDGLTYRIQDSYAYLTNTPGAAWYAPADTNLTFVFPLTGLGVTMRSPDAASTNGGYLELEVAAHAGPLIYLATYAGIPSVTNVPPDPENGQAGYSSTNAPLSWARLCLGSPTETPTLPLTLRSLQADSAQVELAWNSPSNGLYQLQSCSQLTTNGWTDWGNPLPGTGTSQHALDPSSQPQRFYRLLRFP